MVLVAIWNHARNRYDKTMTYSFDIFDTCLVRKCGEPSNVFDLVAEKAFTKPVSTEVRRSFVAARIEAAAATWSDTQTIADIYRAFGFVHPNIRSKEELIELEKSVEREILVPVAEMKERITSLRKAGHRILFVSDMYLSAEFVQPVLQQSGLWEEGDAVYVSCDAGATKASGKLYAYIKEKEQISYRDWHHYGDNEHSDVKVPKKLGIHAHRVGYTYTPYQKAMQQKASLYYQWGGMMAGLSRSIAVQSERTAHKDFVLDIIAPLFATFVYRVMKNAQERGIDALYFCARDAYPLYRIALKMQGLFPRVTVEYLYISRKALYEGDEERKLGYFKQIGLASKTAKNAIVDIRTRGNTLLALNELMRKNGCKDVFGYFYELCSENSGKREGMDYYAELDDLYIQQSRELRKLPSNWYMYELFFPLNTQKRTIGYALKGELYEPVLEEKDNKEYRLEGLTECVDWRDWAFDTYADYFVQMELNQYANEMFEQYVIPQMAEFFQYPDKHYLDGIADFYGLDPEKGFIPYVDKSVWRLPLNVLKHRTMWKRGTIFYSLPVWLSKRLYRRK